MKKLILIAILCCIARTEVSAQPKSDAVRQNLKGAVKSATVYQYDSKNGSKIPESKQLIQISTFSKDGNLLEDSHYVKYPVANFLFNKKVYKYDKQGVCTGYDEVEMGKPFGYTEYQYNQQNQCVVHRHIINGRIISTKTFTYNSDGTISQILISDTGTDSKYSYKYEDRGSIIEESYVNTERVIQRWEYNKIGEALRWTTKDMKDNFTIIDNCYYYVKRDEKGNYTERKIVANDGFIRFEVREIIYYK